MLDKLKNYSLRIYIVVLLGIPIIFIMLFIMLQNSEELQNKNIISIEISHLKALSRNIASRVLQLNKNDLVLNVEKNAPLGEELNNLLTLFITKQYRYVYLIYYDKNGSFRYLADGSKDMTQRGVLGQKFTPSLDIWEKVVRTKKPVFSTQKDISGLWITYLYPILNGNKLEAIIAVDLSMAEYKVLLNATQPFFHTIYILIAFLLVVLLFNFFQAYIYFKQRKKTNLDPLTHLYNRNYLYEISKSISLHNCVVILADIDFFKTVNDTYGHDAGDIVLKEVSKRILKSTRAFDVVVRYGGEEFLLILKNLKKLENAKEICERILKEIDMNPIRLKEGSVHVTISLGVNMVPFLDSSMDRAIKNADIALYKAKERGRNRIVYRE